MIAGVYKKHSILPVKTSPPKSSKLINKLIRTSLTQENFSIYLKSKNVVNKRIILAKF